MSTGQTRSPSFSLSFSISLSLFRRVLCLEHQHQSIKHGPGRSGTTTTGRLSQFIWLHCNIVYKTPYAQCWYYGTWPCLLFVVLQILQQLAISTSLPLMWRLLFYMFRDQSGIERRSILLQAKFRENKRKLLSSSCCSSAQTDWILQHSIYDGEQPRT